MEQSASNMLRHNSGSIISSLQNYGESDEEENDSKNESLREPFSMQSEETTSDPKPSGSPTPDPAESGITFSAEQSNLQGTDSDSNPASRLAGAETDASTAQDGEDERVAPEISPAELISDDEGEHPHSHTRESKSHLKEAVAEALGDGTHADSPSSQGSATKPGRQGIYSCNLQIVF